jgi:O-antigen biosynthesis protein
LFKRFFARAFSTTPINLTSVTRAYVMVTSHERNIVVEPTGSVDFKDYTRQVKQLHELEHWEKMLTYTAHWAKKNYSPGWETQLLVGDALLGLEKWEEAVKLYKTILQNRQSTSVAHYSVAYCKIAIALAQLGQISQADEYYAQFLEKEPASFNTRNFVMQRQAGDFFFRKNNLPAAISAYQKAVDLEPGDSWTHINLGRVLFQMGQETAAVTSVSKAIEIDSNNSSAHYHLATIFLSRQEYDAAEQCCQQALLLQPDSTLLINLLEQISSEKLSSEANNEQTSLSSAHESNAIEANAIEAEAFAQPSAGLSSNAKESVEKRAQEISAQPIEPFEHQYAQGQLLFAQGHFMKALAAYRKAIALKPNFFLAYCELGDTLFQLGKFAEAAWTYHKALELQPRLPQVANKLTQAMQQQLQQQPEPIQQALSELSQNFQQPSLHVSLADTFYHYSCIDDAITHYQTAITLASADYSQRDILLDISDVQQKLAGAIARRNRLHHAFYSPDVVPAEYAAWVLESAPAPEQLSLMPATVCNFQHQPLISIVVPIYNPPEPVLRDMIQSVLDQIYPHWELCIADDCSTQPHVRRVIEEYAQLDNRIKPVFRTQNGHISAASNSAAQVATGEFIALLDHDDELAPHALYEVVSLLNQHPEADMIYSDEDKRSLSGQRTDPYFKPDWSPDTFLSRMYVCHLGTYRRSIFEQIGGFRLGLEGSQDYDLVLRFTEQTNNIFHIPKILYHWRIIESSVTSGAEAKPYAYEAAIRALSEALIRRGEPGRVEMSKDIAGIYLPRYTITDYKRVSIIIPTRNLGKILNTCLKSIFEKTTYPNYEIVLLDNGSDEPETLEIIQYWKAQEPERFNHIFYDVPFNYSKINNYAATQAKGDYFLFLNNDTEIITPDWIEGMVEQAQRSSIGAVGAKMYYEDDTLQHGGVILGIGDAAGHSHRHFPRASFGYVGQLIAVNNYSAVTAACLMCRREVFESVGGFEEALGVAFNDVELCIKMQDAGYRNVWLPHVELYHYESKSRGYEDTPEKMERLQGEAKILRSKWGSVIEQDPCYSPNLTKSKEDYSIKAVPCGDVVKVEQASLQTLSALRSCLDFPKVGKYTAITQVSGWVIGKTSAIKRVDVIADGFIVASTSELQKRADVFAAYPNSEFSLISGFQVQCNLLEVPQETELEVIATLQDDSLVGVGCFQISRNRSINNQRDRGKQKKLARVRDQKNVAPPKSEMVSTLMSVKTVSTGYDESQIFRACIDSPKPCLEVEEINISGWILGIKHNAKMIGVFQNNTIVKEVKVDGSRNDVAKIYPNIIGAEHCGFDIQLAAKELAKDCSKVDVKVFLENVWVKIGAMEIYCKP